MGFPHSENSKTSATCTFAGNVSKPLKMEDNANKNEQEQFVEFIIDDDVYRTTLNKTYKKRKPYEPHNPKKITSFMPGTIQEVFVAPGQEVTATTVLCILEAMKMKNLIFPPYNGVIKAINVVSGQMVPKNFVLIELE
jgi:biotin carboxyl carrier protein